MVDFKKKLKDNKPAGTRKSKVRVKGEQAPQKKLENAGDSVIGFFQGYKIAYLADAAVDGGKKAVRFYEFREEEDQEKRFVTSGRIMLDTAFDEVAIKVGGIENLAGELMEFRRLPDTKLGAGKHMGNYEVEVYETK